MTIEDLDPGVQYTVRVSAVIESESGEGLSSAPSEAIINTCKGILYEGVSMSTVNTHILSCASTCCYQLKDWKL